jgi:hypothetical protein
MVVAPLSEPLVLQDRLDGAVGGGADIAAAPGRPSMRSGRRLRNLLLDRLA